MNRTDHPHRISRTTLFLVASFLIAAMSLPAFATNGYFSHGYGTQSKSMAGVGAAWPTNTLTAATNPAGMAFVGNRYDLALGFFNPNREHTISGNPSGGAGTFPLTPGTVESDSKLFVVPAAGANWMLDDISAVGLSLYGNGGMNTDYDAKVFNNPQAPVTKPTGVNLSQLFLSATYSRIIMPGHAIGISPILAFQMFSADGLQAFGGFSSDGAKLTDNDTDTSFGFGLRIGYMGYVLPQLSVGASYQTRTWMSEFDEYKGLYAEQGDFDIPSNFTVGLAFAATPDLTLGFDVQHIMYSEVNSVGNPMNPAGFQQGIQLGDDNGSGFGWEDMTVFKFGAQCTRFEGLALRAGYSFGSQPVPDEEVMFNILAPGVIEQHLTVGASYWLGEREISASLTKAFNNTVKGANPMEAPGAQMIELAMDQWEFEVGFTF